MTEKALRSSRAKPARAPAPGEIRLALRADLGGRGASLEAVGALAQVPVTAPLVLLAGGNGTGKSTLFGALRRATGLVGTGLGRFPKHEGFDEPLPFPDAWQEERLKAPIDLTRQAVAVRDSIRGAWTDREGHVPAGGPGVLDLGLLGWKGQRIWLHDGRKIDAMDSIRGDFDMRSMRRSADDRLRSHGEQMTGRLRYAVAWALGLFDLRDGYDVAAEPDRHDHARRHEAVPREIFARLAGHRPGAEGRTPERWLLLDEPETGLDPVVFARLMAMLAEGAAVGRLRVFCATHSPLAFALAGQPGVQVIDMDGYASRIERARRELADPGLRAAAATAELERLRADTAVAVVQDRGINGQGRFTAHEALSVPYAEAVKPPYGDPKFLGSMNCNRRPEEPRPRPAAQAAAPAEEAAPEPEGDDPEDGAEFDEGYGEDAPWAPR